VVGGGERVVAGRKVSLALAWGEEDLSEGGEEEIASDEGERVGLGLGETIAAGRKGAIASGGQYLRRVGRRTRPGW